MAKFDLYQTVTNKIVTLIEEGISGSKWTAPWVKSRFDVPHNGTTMNRYNGVNVLLLWGAQQQHGYTSNFWATSKQWKKAGYTLNYIEGSATMIVFWTLLEKTDDKGNIKKIPFLRYSNVYNADLVEGWQEPETPKGNASDDERSEAADKVIENTGAAITYGGNRACYIPSIDTINLPEYDAFKSAEGYYSTTFHELAHWTGHGSRLDRDFSGRFGDEAYAFEELIAELSSAFTCSALGVASETREDHAKYIQSWLKVLKNDKKAIITASSQASKASDFILEGQTAALDKAA